MQFSVSWAVWVETWFSLRGHRLKILSDNLKTFNNENFTKNVPALVKSAFEGPVKPVQLLSFARARKKVLSHCTVVTSS